MTEYVPADQVRAFIEVVRSGIHAETKHTDANDLNVCDALLEAWTAANELERRIFSEPEAAA